MTLLEIRQKQIETGFDKLQNLIDTGNAWHMEGSIGRAAMDALEVGACFLPNVPRRDHYGNTVPSRNQIEDGTKGSLTNTIRFYESN
jgi:hypothetical protein